MQALMYIDCKDSCGLRLLIEYVSNYTSCSSTADLSLHRLTDPDNNENPSDEMEFGRAQSLGVQNDY
jgi:hypothetical protein